MGYDLQNETGNTFRWNVWRYSPILSLAENYGWEPKGTVLSNWESGEIESDWDGKYFSNDGQVVVAEDATNMANALMEALGDIPDEKTSETSIDSEPIEVEDILQRIEELKKNTLSKNKTIKMFSGKGGKKHIKEFIVFLKEGSYVTY